MVIGTIKLAIIGKEVVSMAEFKALGKASDEEKEVLEKITKGFGLLVKGEGDKDGMEFHQTMVNTDGKSHSTTE